MKRIAIGDIHLSGFQSDPLDEVSGLPSRLAAIISNLDIIAAYANSNSINHIDIAGDTIHDKAIIYTTAQDVFKDFLTRHKDINFTIINGNHDISSVGKEKKSAISVFDEYSNVTTVVNKPLIDGNITFIPWYDNFKESTQDVAENDIMIGHVGINEATVSSGLSKVDPTRLSDLKKWKLVILGHYHKPQHLHNDYTNLYYTGSLINKDWNDKNQQKRFLVYDTETLEVESINLSNQREFKEYVIKTVEESDEILAKAQKDKEAGHEVRIKNLCQEKIFEKVEETNDILIIKEEELDPTNRGIDFSQSKEEKLKKYLEIKEISEEDREKYLNLLTDKNILEI